MLAFRKPHLCLQKVFHAGALAPQAAVAEADLAIFPTALQDVGRPHKRSDELQQRAHAHTSAARGAQGLIKAIDEGCRAAYAQAGQATHLVSPPLVLPSAFVGADLVAALSVMDADLPEKRCMRLSGIRLCLAQGVQTPASAVAASRVHGDSHMRSLDAV